MFRVSASLGFSLAFLAMVLALSARPASASENCERFQSPFEYNECLARQAPGQAPRASRLGGTGGADPEASVPAHRRAGNGEEAGPGPGIRRTSRGRVRAVIDPWSGSRQGATAPKRRR